MFSFRAWARQLAASLVKGGGKRPRKQRSTRLSVEQLEDLTLLNAAPVALNDGPMTVHVGEMIQVSAPNGVLGNDTDADNDPLSVATYSLIGNCYVGLNADGSFDFIGYAVGSSGFTYQATDGTDNSNTATVAIDVTNDDPVAGNDVFNLHAGKILSLDATSGVQNNDSVPLPEMFAVLAA